MVMIAVIIFAVVFVAVFVAMRRIEPESAYRQRILRERYESMAVIIGRQLLPIFAEIGRTATEAAAAIDRLAEAFKYEGRHAR